MNSIKYNIDTLILLESGIPLKDLIPEEQLNELSTDDVTSAAFKGQVGGGVTAWLGNKFSSKMISSLGSGAATFFGKLFSFVRAGELGAEALDDFNKGDYKNALIHGLTAVGYVIPQTTVAAGLYDLLSSLYENREDIYAAIKSFFDEKNNQSSSESESEYGPDDYDPDIAEVQKKLNELGANIKVDGLQSPELYKLAVQYKIIEEQ